MIINSRTEGPMVFEGECILCTDEEFLVLEAYRTPDDYVIISKGYKYLVLRVGQSRHPDLYTFCFDNTSRTQAISPIYLNFLADLGRVLYQNPDFFFLTPQECHKTADK